MCRVGSLCPYSVAVDVIMLVFSERRRYPPALTEGLLGRWRLILYDRGITTAVCSNISDMNTSDMYENQICKGCRPSGLCPLASFSRPLSKLKREHVNVFLFLYSYIYQDKEAGLFFCLVVSQYRKLQHTE